MKDIFTKDELYKRLNVLFSFYYVKDWQTQLIHRFNNFMLDSGAFTFMTNKNKKVDYEKYTYAYADFINKNDIKLFFEMDIDSIVGLKEVERLRNIIEKETNRKTIPVWHKSRGKDYFLDMCKEYKYIAIGGIVNGEFGKNFNYINWFCNEAHKNNCKIHGLGFTKKNIKDYKFDSVDSTAWTYGTRCKFICEFNGRDIIKHNMSYKNNRLQSKKSRFHNFIEWVKWSEYISKTYNKDIYLADIHKDLLI